jgi:cyclic pyranopterin phosphate synthase
MKDKWGRTIDYLRLSLTDRCNLRCRYCMPEALTSVGHEAVLRYEEMQLICRAALALGIDRFKITGGEPLVRKGAVAFMESLKAMEGVRSVTLTTNGLLLSEVLPDLVRMGINGINISLDSLDAGQYAGLTGGGQLSVVLEALERATAARVNVKVNAVLLEETQDQILPLARLAGRFPVDVRFIELMPIGYGTTLKGLTEEAALAVLRRAYPDLAATEERRGNGPASYYRSGQLQGRIGFIAANTHGFCSSCNRLRLTSTGFLKPCLCYDDGVDLRAIVRSGQGEETICQELQRAMARAVYDKPAKHCFAEQNHISEHKTMNQIGG